MIVAGALGAVLAVGLAIAGPNTGKLSLIQTKADPIEYAGVNDLDSCRDGQNVYVANYNADTLVTFARRQRSGRLREIDVETDGENVTGMGETGDVVCSRDGRFVYVTASEDDDDAILAFARNQRTGKLRFKHRKTDSQDRLESVYGLTASPDGRFLYATASSSEHNLLTYRRNARNGRLSLRDVETDDPSLEGSGTPVVSPDGANLYVPGDDSVGTFKRNLRTGKLRFVNVKADGTGQIEGLQGAYGIDVSRDNRNVYATGYGDGAIVSFKRNRRSGKLRFLDAKFDGAAAGDRFSTPYDVFVSRDGHNVYAAAYGDDAINVFRRNDAGRIRFVQSKAEGDNGPWRMDLTRDDRNLYAAGYDAGTVTVYKRRP